MYFLLNLGHCVKRYGPFCQILAFFAMPTHQIWSCHVTQVANFSTFNIRKIPKISGAKCSLRQKLSAKNLTGGMAKNLLFGYQRGVEPDPQSFFLNNF